jgi:hypothetical protein
MITVGWEAELQVAAMTIAPVEGGARCAGPVQQ